MLEPVAIQKEGVIRLDKDIAAMGKRLDFIYSDPDDRRLVGLCFRLLDKDAKDKFVINGCVSRAEAFAAKFLPPVNGAMAMMLYSRIVSGELDKSAFDAAGLSEDFKAIMGLLAGIDKKNVDDDSFASIQLLKNISGWIRDDLCLEQPEAQRGVFTDFMNSVFFACGSLTGDAGSAILLNALKTGRILQEAGLTRLVPAGILFEIIRSGMDKDIGYKYSDIADIADSALEIEGLLKRYGADDGRSAHDPQAYLDSLTDRIGSDAGKITALNVFAASLVSRLAFACADKSDKEEKQNLIDITGSLYLPVLKSVELNYFARLTADLLWKLDDPGRYASISELNRALLASAADRLIQFDNYCRQIVNATLRYQRKPEDISGRLVFRFSRRYLQPSEIPELCDKKADELILQPGLCDKRAIPVCLYRILENDDSEVSLRTLLSIFLKTAAANGQNDGYIISGVSTSDNAYIVDIDDKYDYTFRCVLTTRAAAEHYDFNTDAAGLFPSELSAPTRQRMITVNYITHDSHGTLNDSHGTLILPQGASVIDAAFAISYETGIFLSKARINGRIATIYSILRDNNVIEIKLLSDKDRADPAASVVKFDWIEHVVCSNSLHCLVEYFNDQKRGRAVDGAPSDAVRDVSDSLCADVINALPSEDSDVGTDTPG